MTQILQSSIGFFSRHNSDTHADNTITVTNANGGDVLAEGLNTITATSVCLTSSGSAVSVPAVYLNIEGEEQEDGSTLYTYTAYSDAEMATEALYTYTSVAWPAEWTEYKFDATKAGSEIYFWIWPDGQFLFGSETDYGNFTTSGMSSGASGYWGYIDGTLTFAKRNGLAGYTEVTYTICETAVNSDGTFTIGCDNSGSALVVTIDDIGCLVGDGYDLDTLLSEYEYSTSTGVLTSD